MATKKITKIISSENGDNYVADIEDIENRITQNSSNLETAKQELSSKCDTVLSDAKTYTDTKKNEALNEAKAYTDQEKQKYIPLTGSDQLSDGNFICTKQNPESMITIGSIRGLKEKNDWRTGGLVVLSAGASNRKGACQFFASRKINEGSDDDDANFLTTSFTVMPEGTIQKATSKGNTTVVSFVETQRIKNGPNQTCILYENGWCLQCGRVWVPENSNFATVNLLTPFRDTGYVVFCMARDPDDNTNPSVASTNFNSKTTTSFHVVSSYLSSGDHIFVKSESYCGIDWLALGFVN